MSRAAAVMLLVAAAWLAACTGFVDQFTGEDVSKEIREVGLPARATVLEIWETGVRVNDNPVVGFLLEVHAAGLDPWQAETKALVSILAIPRIQPGAVLEVLYDPEDPTRVTIDMDDDRER